MKTKLVITDNGQEVEKEFSTIRMRGRALKRMLEVQDTLEAANKENVFAQEHWDMMCTFICEMFGNQFSEDDLLDGMDLEDIYPVFVQITEEIGNKTMKKVQNLIKN